jgi:hypothetical protein
MDLNAKINKLFSLNNDCVMWNLYDKPEDAFYDGEIITSIKLNSIVLSKTNSKKIIILPCNRSTTYYKHLQLSKKAYTYKELFIKLNNFYTKKNLTIRELKKIPNDFHDYVKDAIKNGNTISLIDIMGSLCRFEDISRINKNIDHIFLVDLGS